jgi:hypothetical protein
MTRNGMIEYRLDGVIALPANCADAEKKLVKAMIALVEAMEGQIGGQIVHRLTDEDYKAMEAELQTWQPSVKARPKSKSQLTRSKSQARRVR